MSKQSDRVKAWRKNIKKKIVDAFGGKCGICGYSKCYESLAFHHLNPDEKEFSLGSIIAHPKRFDLIINEMKKCICVCNNCHGEIHSGVTIIPENINKFDDTCIKEKLVNPKTHPCPVCGKDTPEHNITCSRQCSSARTNKINWDLYDVVEMKKTMSIMKISEIIGCSDVAVHKRLKKMGVVYEKTKTSRKLNNVLDKDFIADLENMTKTQIMKKYNICKETIIRYCVSKGIDYKKYNKNKF